MVLKDASELMFIFGLSLLSVVSLLVPLLLIVAMLTLLERKVMGAMQRRRGPNVVGLFGLLQPIADGLKLVLKEAVFPIFANRVLFFLAPCITFLISLLNWSFVPISEFRVFGSFSYDLLAVLALSSFGVYGIIIAGWASNSKYSFFGALRSAAQMVAYEVSLTLTFLILLMVVRSFSFFDFVESQHQLPFILPFFVVALLVYVSMLAELNRTPFDLPEAEGELVAGYNVEYSAVYFALFYLGEYFNIVLSSTIFTLVFLGGWLTGGVYLPLIFAIKVYLLLYSFIWVRATFPRYRFDQLIQIGWKQLLPVAMAGFIYVLGVRVGCEGLLLLMFNQ